MASWTDPVALDLPTALHRISTCLLVGALAWACLVAALASCPRTARWARAITPRALRIALFTAMSGSLAISPARAAGDLDGLPLPTRASTVEPAADRHVVVPGESLWAISAASLPPDASAAAIADESAAWYRHNRLVIGPDADLIRPGQVLLLPEGRR